MKIDKTPLKTAIKAHTSEIGGDRRKATSLFKQGRRLRRSGEATTTGWELHGEAARLRPGAYERQRGRELTLAAAFLNNTPFGRCEGAEADSTAYWLRHVHQLISQCYPEGGAPSLALVQEWVKTRTATRRSLMPAPVELQQAA